MAYCDQDDLVNAMGLKTFTEIFDDDEDGEVEPAAVTACLEYGSDECDSFLLGVYDVEFPLSPVPTSVKFAAVDFCMAYAVRRRPDKARAMSEQPWTVFRDSAVKKMKRFADAKQRLPRTVETPSSIGTSVERTDNRTDIPVDDRTFGNMGDFS